MKVVINRCFGGFSISQHFAAELGMPSHVSSFGGKTYYECRDDSLRTDPRVIKAIEDGRNINGDCAELAIVEIPDDVDWEIDEYDGSEWVAEKHRTWR